MTIDRRQVLTGLAAAAAAGPVPVIAAAAPALPPVVTATPAPAAASAYRVLHYTERDTLLYEKNLEGQLENLKTWQAEWRAKPDCYEAREVVKSYVGKIREMEEEIAEMQTRDLSRLYHSLTPEEQARIVVATPQQIEEQRLITIEVRTYRQRMNRMMKAGGCGNSCVSLIRGGTLEEWQKSNERLESEENAGMVYDRRMNLVHRETWLLTRHLKEDARRPADED